MWVLTQRRWRVPESCYSLEHTELALNITALQIIVSSCEFKKKKGCHNPPIAMVNILNPNRTPSERPSSPRWARTFIWPVDWMTG